MKKFIFSQFGKVRSARSMTEYWVFGEVSCVRRMSSLASSSHGRRWKCRSQGDKMPKD